LNLNEEDIAKELYMGYGIGLGPLLVIPAVWVFWGFQGFGEWVGQVKMYPQEFYWVNRVCMVLSIGIANFVD